MAPMLLGFALAVPFEDGLTKALEQQQFLTMWDRPTSLALLALATSVIGFSVGRQLWQRIQRLRPAAH
jgi:TctA family transporter